MAGTEVIVLEEVPAVEASEEMVRGPEDKEGCEEGVVSEPSAAEEMAAVVAAAEAAGRSSAALLWLRRGPRRSAPRFPPESPRIAGTCRESTERQPRRR